jgi:4-amino-4-deoxy-L-arabinose transferase-like glycosyltransferase
MANTLPLWRRPPIAFSLLIFAIFGFAIFFELARMDVVSDNEGQRAAPPAEMLRSGNYVVPTINHEAYLAKPPLLYWAITPVYRLTGGPSEWAARLPGGLCAIALVMCVYILLRGVAGERHAYWAALMTGIAPYVLERARWTQLDVPLTLAMFLAITVLHLSSGRIRPILLGGIACGASMMLKGPVVFPFLWAGWVASVFAAETNGNNNIRVCVRWTLVALALDFALRGVGGLLDYGGVLTFPWGLLLLIGVWTWYAGRADWGGGRLFTRWVFAAVLGGLCVAPWAIAVLREVGWAYVQALLDEQVIERTHTASAINSGSTIYFFAGAPFMLAPWGLLLPAVFSQRLWDRNGSWYRFAVTFGGVSVAAFSLFAGKEYEYILPAIPFLASALAYVWLHEGDYGASRALNAWVRGWKAVLPGLMAASLLVVSVYFSVANPDITLLIEIWAGVFIAGAARWMLRRKDGPTQLAVMAFATIMVVLVARSFHYTGDRSPQAIVQLTAELQREGYTVETSKTYPAFAFYSEIPIPELQDVDRLAENLQGDSPYFFLTRIEIAEAYLQEIPPEYRQVLAGPVTSKNHILIGNTPLPEKAGS